MIHLKIRPIGYLNIAQPPWPQALNSGCNQFSTQGYRSIGSNQPQEAILQVELTKRDWDEMFDLYESHHRAMLNPAVRDAWEQYQIVRHMTAVKEAP